MEKTQFVSLADVKAPTKMFYGLVTLGSAMVLGTVIAEMFTLGVTVMPALIALLSLVVLGYSVFKFVKIWNAEKAVKEMESITNAAKVFDAIAS